jgi:hypothetical protein
MKVKNVIELISDSTPVKIFEIDENGDEFLVYEDGDVWPRNLDKAKVDFICAGYPEYGVMPIIKIYIK